MAARGRAFYGVVEGSSVVWYGNFFPGVSDLTPVVYRPSDSRGSVKPDMNKGIAKKSKGKRRRKYGKS